MRRLMFVLALVLVGVVGLGFYQGWLRMSVGKTDHKVEMNVTIDEGQIQDETQRAGQQAQETGKKVEENAKHAARHLGRKLEDLGDGGSGQEKNGSVQEKIRR